MCFNIVRATDPRIFEVLDQALAVERLDDNIEYVGFIILAYSAT